jgi:hypothetical protein
LREYADNKRKEAIKTILNLKPKIKIGRKNLKWPALTGDKAVARPTESTCKEATPSEIE